MGQMLYHSPIGVLCVESIDGIAVNRVWFTEEPAVAAPSNTGSKEERCNALFEEVTGQLNAYFSGSLQQFSFPLQMTGTPFSLKVWQALQEIPYGTTMSYGELAQHIGNIKAVRAVGHANGNNPLSIIVPCHRVIGAQGQLVGYHWGIERKRWLLEHEKRILAQTDKSLLF